MSISSDWDSCWLHLSVCPTLGSRAPEPSHRLRLPCCLAGTLRDNESGSLTKKHPILFLCNLTLKFKETLPRGDNLTEDWLEKELAIEI